MRRSKFHLIQFVHALDLYQDVPNRSAAWMLDMARSMYEEYRSFAEAKETSHWDWVFGERAIAAASRYDTGIAFGPSPLEALLVVDAAQATEPKP